MYYSVYRDIATQWRWRLVAANGKIVANSGEGYYNKSDCYHAIGLVVGTSSQTPVYEE